MFGTHIQVGQSNFVLNLDNLTKRSFVSNALDLKGNSFSQCISVPALSKRGQNGLASSLSDPIFITIDINPRQTQ